MKVKLLEKGDAYKNPQDKEVGHEEEDEKTWCPNWLGHVSNDVNAKFIKEIIDHVYNNEKV
jgi:hypothetical protein